MVNYPFSALGCYSLFKNVLKADSTADCLVGLRTSALANHRNRLRWTWTCSHRISMFSPPRVLEGVNTSTSSPRPMVWVHIKPLSAELSDR